MWFAATAQNKHLAVTSNKQLHNVSCNCDKQLTPSEPLCVPGRICSGPMLGSQIRKQITTPRGAQQSHTQVQVLSEWAMHTRSKTIQRDKERETETAGEARSSMTFCTSRLKASYRASSDADRRPGGMASRFLNGSRNATSPHDPVRGREGRCHDIPCVQRQWMVD